MACYYYFTKSVHNIHSIVWCVCMCVHVRYCYFVFTAHTCLHLLIQEIYMHNYATFSSQFICIFLNQRITAWFILSNVDVCYVCCRDKQSNNHCTHSFNNVYCVRVCAYVCVWLATCCFTEPHTNIIHNLLLASQDASVYIRTEWGIRKGYRELRLVPWSTSQSSLFVILLLFLSLCIAMFNNQTIWSRYRLAYIENSSERSRVTYRCTAFTSFINTLVATSSRDTAQIDSYQLFYNIELFLSVGVSNRSSLRFDFSVYLDQILAVSFES